MLKAGNSPAGVGLQLVQDAPSRGEGKRGEGLGAWGRAGWPVSIPPPHRTTPPHPTVLRAIFFVF